MQESASFWTDIKSLEEQLEKSPDSLCFARLSDAYLKVGLIDDALHVARQGVKKHPRYLSGQRAFSLACNAKGLVHEALVALKLVTEALPEDVPSQKLLGRLLAEIGDQDAAFQAFQAVLEFEPDDVECRIELESLGRSAWGAGPSFEPEEDDEEIIEDLEILEEFDLPEKDQLKSGFQFQEATSESDSLAGSLHDPLSTGTLAELYVRQGFINKALKIYRAILADNPADRVIAERVVELEALESGSIQPDSEIDDTFEEEAEYESFSRIQAETLLQKKVSASLPEYGLTPEPTPSGDVIDASTAPSLGVADNALSTLDGWLDNIRRIKSCR